MLFVLSRVPSWLEMVLQAAGGIFLLYLAWGAFRSWRNYLDAHAPAPQRTVLKGALVNLLNPAPYLSWSLVMGPMLLQGWHEAPSSGIALLVSFYVTMLSGLAGIILLFSPASSLGPRVGRALVGISALALAGFGGYELWLGLSRAAGWG